MKVTKSLLLGAAAGLVALSGAQAADLPVKAKPVEYVKICSAYGAGFYYIPGTDICLRVGGYVYLETGVKGNNAVANIYGAPQGVSGLTGEPGAAAGTGSAIDYSNNYATWRTSARVILDARNNTAYGTLRAYMVTGGAFNTNHTTVVSWDAAFIQFAGFTWGYTNSMASFGYAGYGIVASPMVDWSWINIFAYTAQLGNGVSATLSAEDPRGRRAAILSDNINPFPGYPNVSALDVITPAGAASLYGFNHYGGSWTPDVVANLNVTQAWGRAQIMGAIHQVKPNNSMHRAINPGTDSKYGYMLGGGFEIKTPQTGNPNNSVLVEGHWTKGATDYTGYNSSPTATQGTVFALSHLNVTGPVAVVGDAYYDTTANSMKLIKAWSAYGAYRHYWTPMLRTAFAYGYLEIENPNVTTDPNIPGDIEVHQANVSTVWSPVAGLDLSLDLVWSRVEVTNSGQGNTGAASAGAMARNGSNDIWSAWTRLRRNF
jgi:hypothetical protein